MTPDDLPPDDDFGAMLEASLRAERKRLSVGERVRATVVQVGQERLMLDLGGGQDGLMELGQFDDDEARASVKEGDVIEAYVLGFENRVADLGLKPGRGMGRGAGGRAALEDASRTGLPVEGVVVEVNKGGYVVEIAGARCFCPLGAMDVRRIEDPSTLIGQKLAFRVTEMKGPRDVVLSRRALLEEENARRAAETREQLRVGARLAGTIVNVRDFGAFVDLGGIQGLVPASELGHGWRDPHEAVRLGQSVHVEVLAIEQDKGRERITLSMKALQDDPFTHAPEHLQPGLIVAGRVTRVQPFGAFIEIVPGVEGLIHVSAFGRRIGHPSDVVRPEQIVAVRIEGVDAVARRISLHLADAAELVAEEAGGAVSDDRTLAAVALLPGLRVLRRAEPVAAAALISAAPGTGAEIPASATARIGDVFDVTVDRAESYGVFVSWASGRGLVPARELGTPRGADLRRQFPAGATFRAALVDIRPDGKLTLSVTAIERAAERAETESYQKSATSRAGSSGFGTLGDIMNAKRGR